MKAFAATVVLLSTSAVSHAISISVTVTHHDICNYGGRIEIGVSGAVPPYQIFLNTGQEYTGWSLEGLPAGVYQATVTDALLEQAVADFEVLAQSSFAEGYTSAAYPSPNCGEGGRTIGQVYNENGPYGDPGSLGNVVPGYAPLTINAPFTAVPTTYPSCWTSSYLLEISGPPGTEQDISYTDANGCPGTIHAWVVQPSALPTLDLLDITGSCSNTSTGSVTVATHGGYLFDCAIRFYVYRSDGTLVNGTCSGFGYGNIETLPASETLRNLPAGDLTLRVQLQHFQGGGNWNEVPWPILPTCYQDYPLTIPDNGPCAVVTGTVFVDGNESCTRGGSESRVDNAIVEVSPGPYYATNLSSGTYSLALPVGGPHTINVQHPALEAICTPLSFNATIGSTRFRDVPTRSLVPLDVAVFINSGAARPGFQLRYGVKVKNLTPPGSSTTVTMEFDPTLAYVGADPAPISVVGNVITWSAYMYGWMERSFTVDLQVPPDVGLIGTDLITSSTVTTTSTDGNLANNTAVDVRTVTGSYDPNDKLARTSSGDETSWNIGTDEWVDYTIRFQNTGNDTAFHIIITDTLPNTLDPASVQTTGASHPYSWEVAGQGVLKFRLLNILLPDSNVNEAASHGFVSFRIKAREPLVPGTTIENIANIYFDFNPPVITEPSILTVVTPGVAISPRVLLGGPYDEPTQRMGDALRSAGLIPLTEPYTALGYTHMNGGGETTSAPVLAVTGDHAIVDWVVVELRSNTAPYPVLATKSALLQRDGDVVATNGTGPVFFNLSAGVYRVSIRHRNHLGVMTDGPVALDPVATVVDFSSSTSATYGTNAQATVATRRVLWAGDCQGDGELKYTGDENDRDLILQEIGGVAPTATSTGYVREDVNMDGLVKYTGANNDRDRILENIGGTVPTNVVVEQLP